VPLTMVFGVNKRVLVGRPMQSDRLDQVIALFTGYTPWIALAVGVLMLVVVASYRQTCTRTRPVAGTTRCPAPTSGSGLASRSPAL
jgi:hypothetical protein